MPELDDLLLQYRHHLVASNCATSTVRSRVWMIRRFAGHMDRPLMELTLPDLVGYIAMKRVTLGPSALKSVRSALRSFYGWAADAGYVEVSPAEKLPPIRIPMKVARRAPDDVIHQALALATLDEKAAILLGRLAGLRLSEIASLPIEAREGDMLRVVGKGSKVRMVPVPEALAAVLDRLGHLRGGEGYFFPGRFGGHVHPQSLGKQIKARTGWNPHSLRHAYATAAYNGSNNDIRAVQEALGHASPTTTQLYVHTTTDALRAAANAAAFGFDDGGSSAVERAATNGPVAP